MSEHSAPWDMDDPDDLDADEDLEALEDDMPLPMDAPSVLDRIKNQFPQTTDSTLAAMAKAAGLPLDEPERSRALADRFNRPGRVTPPEHTELLRWANQVVAPWYDTYAGVLDRVVPPQPAVPDAHLLPAMLVLSAYADDGESRKRYGSQAQMAEMTFDILRRRGPGLVFESWKILGLPTRAELAELAGEAARQDKAEPVRAGTVAAHQRSAYWAALAGHPNASTELVSQAVAVLEARGEPTRTRTVLLQLCERPDAFGVEALRRAMWRTELEAGSRLPDLVAATPPDEFGELVESLSGDARYLELARAMELATVPQLAAVQVSASTVADWCAAMPGSAQPALLRAIAGLTTIPDPPGTPPSGRRLR